MPRRRNMEDFFGCLVVVWHLWSILAGSACTDIFMFYSECPPAFGVRIIVLLSTLVFVGLLSFNLYSIPFASTIIWIPPIKLKNIFPNVLPSFFRYSFNQLFLWSLMNSLVHSLPATKTWDSLTHSNWYWNGRRLYWISASQWLILGLAKTWRSVFLALCHLQHTVVCVRSGVHDQMFHRSP